MSWIKKLLISAAIISTIILGLGAIQSGLGETETIAILKASIMSGRADEFITSSRSYRNEAMKEIVLFNKENTTAHDNFEWSWTNHSLAYWYYVDAPEYAFLVISSAEYQEFITADSRGFVNWIFTDTDADGILDKTMRDFVLVMQNNEIMMPSYPKGFRNIDWYTPSQEEAEARFNEELLYWINLLKGE